MKTGYFVTDVPGNNTGRKLLGTKQAPSVPGSMRPATGVLKMGCW